MKNIRFLMIAFLSVSLFFTSCRKDIDEIIDTPILNEGEILGSITGQVIDERNLPVENATVFLKDDMQTTDENGFFLFKDKALNSLGTVVKAQSSKHIEVSKIVNPKSNAKTIVNIKLLDKKLSGTIDATSGGIVQVSDGDLEGQIDFPENAFVLKGSNTSYTGSVQVFARIINPANEDDILTIPGDLRGMDISNEVVQLASYSMMSVSIETGDRMELELADNKEALISFPVDPTLQSSVPATIPLWHYNIETGHWEEEGNAELINNQYQGKVSHFSFWNCDVPFPLVQISGRVVDENNNPFVGITVGIRVVDGGLTAIGYTNASGEFSGGVPKNQNLLITFSKDYQCIEFTNALSIGPFTENIVLEDIIKDLSSNDHIISGRLLDCEEEISQNGYLLMSSEDKIVIIHSNKNDGFFTIPACFTTFSLTAIDYVNGFKSEPIYFELPIEEDTDIGNVFLCEEFETYIKIKYKENEFKKNGAYSLKFEDILQFKTASIDSFDISYINLQVHLNEGEIVGEYNDSFVNALFNDNDQNEIRLGCSITSPVTCAKVEIIIAQPTGGYIMGNFEAMVINTLTEEKDIPVSGSFKVLSTL